MTSQSKEEDASNCKLDSWELRKIRWLYTLDGESTDKLFYFLKYVCAYVRIEVNKPEHITWFFFKNLFSEEKVRTRPLLYEYETITVQVWDSDDKDDGPYTCNKNCLSWCCFSRVWMMKKCEHGRFGFSKVWYSIAGQEEAFLSENDWARYFIRWLSGQMFYRNEKGDVWDGQVKLVKRVQCHTL